MSYLSNGCTAIMNIGISGFAVTVHPCSIDRIFVDEDHTCHQWSQHLSVGLERDRTWSGSSNLDIDRVHLDIDCVPLDRDGVLLDRVVRSTDFKRNNNSTEGPAIYYSSCVEYTNFKVHSGGYIESLKSGKTKNDFWSCLHTSGRDLVSFNRKSNSRSRPRSPDNTHP